MLVSVVQQSESMVCIYISPLFWISFLFISPQSIEYPVLYSKFLLVIYFIHPSVYMPVSVSQFILYLLVTISLFSTSMILLHK